MSGRRRMREEDLHKKLMYVFFSVLVLLLMACSNAGSTLSPQGVPTSATTSTPSITPSASTVSSRPVLPLTAIRIFKDG